MNSRFYLSRRERRRLLYLLFILLLVFAVRLTWENANTHPSCSRPLKGDHEVPINRTQVSTPPKGGWGVHSFDPNEADSTLLLRLGLTPAQVRSICRHRARGYRYHTPEDFMYTPFLTNEQWQHLRPLIRISEKYHLVTPPKRNRGVSISNSPTPITQHPTPLKGDHEVPFKERIDINTADSATLCSVPGIGPYWADKILRLRHRYGGFSSLQQLADEPRFPQSTLAYLSVSSDGSSTTPHVIRPLRINGDSFQRLVNHPYLTYSQVRTIKDYQRKYGPLHTMQDLLSLPGFTPEDTLRLTPYIEF